MSKEAEREITILNDALIVTPLFKAQAAFNTALEALTKKILLL